MSVTSIADELYGLLPAEFTAARNAAIAQNKQLKDELMALRKPTPAAWVVNLLVRQRASQLDDVLDLGAQLREAQGDLDREALASLTVQRRHLVSALAKQGAALAEVAGHAVSSSAVDEVAQTLQAAMADPDAAEAVRTGRLVRPLEVNGLVVELEGAVAGGGSSAPRRRADPQVDELEEKRAQKRRQEAEAAKAREAAQTAHELAERAVADATRARTTIEDRLDDAKQRVSELKTELAAADKTLKAAAAQRDAAADAASRLAD